MANDVIACEGTREIDVLAYYAACDLGCNAVLLPFGDVAPIMALCTTRNVAEGEELLVSYGHQAWNEHGTSRSTGSGNGGQAGSFSDVDAWLRIEKAAEKQSFLAIDVFQMVEKNYPEELQLIRELMADEPVFED